jgi:DNA-binding GntR family transcriptional regulator
MAKVSAEDRAHKEIIKLILSQKYAPGDRLVEAELAQELGLSRTPVRNALRKLIAEGLLENQDNKGCLIPRITPSDMEAVFSVRTLLEGRAAAAAARMATGADIDALRKLLAEERNLYAQGSMELYTEVNQQIHLGIAALSRNDYLERFIRQAFWRAELYIFFFDRFYIRPGGPEAPLRDPEKSQSCREHACLIEAISSRDSATAESVMKEHIQSTYQTITRRVFSY